MSLLKLTDAHLAFGHWPLLAGVQFQLEAGERVALLGRNGTGKSSMLAVLAGNQALDAGSLWRAPGKLGYVPQEPQFAEDDDVFAAVVSGMGDTAQLLKDYHHVSHALAAEDVPAAQQTHLLQQLETLQHELDSQQAWSFASRAEQVINTFGLDADSKISTLSGGQKKRLALARALAHSPQVLLLDEPTNHLDIAAIVWLEELLRQPAHAHIGLVFITHDRRFLENVASRIIELDRGKLASFPGQFCTYLERKAFMLAEEAQQNARADKLLKAEEVWIRQGVQARRTRSVYRVEQLELLRAARAERRARVGNINLQVDRGERSGQLVAELDGVCKSFVDADGQPKLIVNQFSTRIMAGDKVGLIGRNGAGKTTLLRLILGELAADAGTVRLGSKQTIAYFDQFRTQLDLEARLQDVIGSESEFVEIHGKRKHVIGYLEDFLFPPERARSQVKMLSGGERNRLLLAKLFARPANVLVLDEPTNDLDMETLELLEQLLSDYRGTVFLVSHDRAFLDNIVTQSLVFEGGNDGRWHEYVGGYTDWQTQSTTSMADAFAPATSAKPREATTSVVKAPPAAAAAPAPLTWKEKQELAAIPDKISQLENEQRALTTRLETPALYQNPEEAQAVAHRLAAIDAALLTLLERWEALEK